jgi:hypothetical protein
MTGAANIVRRGIMRLADGETDESTVDVEREALAALAALEADLANARAAIAQAERSETSLARLADAERARAVAAEADLAQARQAMSSVEAELRDRAATVDSQGHPDPPLGALTLVEMADALAGVRAGDTPPEEPT